MILMLLSQKLLLQKNKEVIKNSKFNTLKTKVNKLVTENPDAATFSLH